MLTKFNRNYGLMLSFLKAKNIQKRIITIKQHYLKTFIWHVNLFFSIDVLLILLYCVVRQDISIYRESLKAKELIYYYIVDIS